MEQVEKQAEKRHGGYRPGAGRKSKYGVKTIVMRVPEDRVQEVQNLIGGGPVETVTESKDETVTESIEYVTESKPLDELKAELEEARKEIKSMAVENSRLSQQLISANENAKAAEDLAGKMEAQAADKGGKLERVQAELEALKGTVSNQAPNLLDDFMVIKERWRERLKPHQDPDGKVTQPRWAKCWDLWQELARALYRSESSQGKVS
jgi:F0F1-type ATP synthase membrane subunit b/b'